MSKKNNTFGLGRRLRDALIRLSRTAKQLISAGSDTVGFALCAYGAVWLIGGSGASEPLAISLIASTATVALLLAWSLGLYRSVVRYMGLDLFVAGLLTAVGAAFSGAAVAYFANIVVSPLRWAIVVSGMLFIYICGSRYIVRIFLINHRSRIERERVIIYGAGSAGAQLASGLLGGDQFLPVAIVDDDESLRNKTVQGLRIHPPSNIESLIKDTHISRVLLAIPSASLHRRRAVLERLSNFPVRVQTMPGIEAIVSGKAQVDDISDVVVEDLLGRDPIPPNPRLLCASITGKNVMVTGAGGSIGSELCRQIILLKPKLLVLFELSEIALYDIDKELQAISENFSNCCEIVALLGSVHHKESITEVMQTFEINTVYHAAAYKHVPVVEQNILEGIHNNIFGTLHAAEAAASVGVETFVLISTDKAVSPTSVMGATKRFAELILQAMQAEHPDTRFCMVRFGNVLESSGSVVPLFRKQIRSGGPVTVTHRDIIRYFMTIPEAAQLVIQAAAMAEGGDVFVLDMGKPIKILDLALRMINLMGFTVRDENNPDGDIEIRFTGLRPAEKLYEELLSGENIFGTEHRRIMRAKESFLTFDSLQVLIEQLRDASKQFDRDRARAVLKLAVQGYGARNGIEDLVWVNQRKSSGKGTGTKVVAFPLKKN